MEEPFEHILSYIYGINKERDEGWHENYEVIYKKMSYKKGKIKMRFRGFSS